MFLKKHRMYAKWIREPIRIGSVDMPSSRTLIRSAITSCGFMWIGSNIPENKIVELNRKWKGLCEHFGIMDEVVGTLFVDKVRRIQANNARLPEW